MTEASVIAAPRLPADLERRIVARAMSYVGTPYVHRGRRPGLGGALDCVGVAVCVGKDEGLHFVDLDAYEEEPDPEDLLWALNECCDRIDPRRRAPADLLAFWLRGPDKPQHTAFEVWRGERGEEQVVHARLRRSSPGKSLVCKERLSSFWLKRLHSVWRPRWS